MFGQTQQGFDKDDVARARQEAGKLIRSLRESSGLSQRDLAKAAGVEYYTFISQIESGRGRVPPLQMKAFAKAFNIPEPYFAKMMMKYYDPVTFDMLFGGESAGGGNEGSKPDAARGELEARVLRLEKLLSDRANG